ncbi:hypothetical protein MC7420_5502 [Coleofasciculus chthonoplastes PCC 7420]|uniref:PemK-like protein n=1 Tax=Coleofasciculus chthonoplastes PCC 7420 TaxID=118168 RepID=B4VPC4_9CYAN|nr:type II toxin-antitoxin system PemK/MazF family toxin [Coleofasciculus chthonoplastes]EDX76068.1 hypothetical protein MC7420_5502 [Coleofasciculus chthonoplastes PCC 7420]
MVAKPLSSLQIRRGFVPAGVGGLSQNSVILCEQIRVIDKSRIIRVLGHLDDIYLQELAQALCTILDLSL